MKQSHTVRYIMLTVASITMLLGCIKTTEHSQLAAQKKANLFFIGQDLGAIRDYVDSDCCLKADGGTAYVGLYNVLSPTLNYGGLGLDKNGEPIDDETGWGAGPVSAFKTATDFNLPHLAIGLFIANNDEPGALSALVAGEHDDKIRQLTKLFRHVDGDIYLRIGYEFDGVWNAGHEDVELYKAAWRRIVDIIRADGVRNVQFVWQSGASPIDDIIEEKRENIADWYPGDDYVDWIGLSWFIDGDETRSVPHSYPTPAARVLANEVLAFARDRNKPVMIAEAAAQAYDIVALTSRHHSPLWDGPAGAEAIDLTADEIWQRWFAPFFSYVRANDDIIDAIAYINCNWEAQEMWGPPYESGYWGDTRVTVNAEIAKRWNNAIREWRVE